MNAPSVSRLLLAAASAVLFVALPARAEAPHDAMTLNYLPSRGTLALCPGADFLAWEVEIRLGYPLVQPSAPDHLTVRINRANGLFRAIGEMRDDAGNVTFTRTYTEILSLRFGGDWTLTPRLAIRAYVDASFQPLSGIFIEMFNNSVVWSQPGLSGSVGLGPVFTFSSI